MSRALINNFWMTGTVTALSQVSSLPAIFTQTPERTQIYRSLSQTADQYLLLDAGSSRTFDFIALANVKLQNAGNIQLYSGGTGASPGAYSLVCTLGPYDLDTQMCSKLFTPVTARHWKILFINGSIGVADYVETGYVGLGAATIPDDGCVPEISYERIDPSVIQQSVDGQKSFTTRRGYFVGSVTYDFLLEADATKFHNAWRTVAKQIPFFFALDENIANQQWLIRFGEGLKFSRRGGLVPIYRISFDWEEAR